MDRHQPLPRSLVVEALRQLQPCTAAQLATDLHIPVWKVRPALYELQRAGLVVTGDPVPGRRGKVRQTYLLANQLPERPIRRFLARARPPR